MKKADKEKLMRKVGNRITGLLPFETLSGQPLPPRVAATTINIGDGYYVVLDVFGTPNKDEIILTLQEVLLEVGNEGTQGTSTEVDE